MMRVAPDDPEKANGFLHSRFSKQVLRQAGGPFTSSIVQLSQNLTVIRGTRTTAESDMERVFRSLKTEWMPTVGYMTAQEAHRDISHYLMHRYNWIRPHQFNGGLAPAQAEKKLNVVSGIS